MIARVNTTPPTTPAPATPGLVACVAYAANGQRLQQTLAIEDIGGVLATAGHWIWVGLHEPDEALLARLQAAFGLHELAVEDAHKAHQRAKIDTYGDSLFVVAQTAALEQGEVRAGEVHAFLGRNYLVTIRHGRAPSLTAARRTAEQSPALMALGPSYGLYAVLDCLVDRLLPVVRGFREELQELEEAIFEEDFQPSTIRRLYDLKKELASLRLGVTPLQDLLGQLIRQYPELVRDRVRPYFRDVLDHATRVADAMATLSEMLSAAISVNLSLVTYGQGEIVKRLAGWAALLGAPTLITSWYGMNFAGMRELESRWAYPAVIVFTALTCLLLYRLLRRARWL